MPDTVLVTLEPLSMAEVCGVVTEESVRREGGGPARGHTSGDRGEAVGIEVDK